MEKNSIVKTIFILSIFIVHCINTIAQTASDKIDQLFLYCNDKEIFTGSVLVVEKGSVVYKNVAGYSNLEKKELWDINTPSCIGSISKQFTAMAVMILKEQNKLSYEDKLNMYFPKLPGADDITIRQLLNHTSGTIRYVNLPELRANGTVKTGITNKDIYEVLIQRDSLIFEPGTNYAYSNSGYIILAMIVEKVSGVFFHKFLKEKIFIPLSMQNTFLWNKLSSSGCHKAIGYNNYSEIYDYDVFVEGAGGIYSTVEDLYKWDQALYSEKLVSKETLQEAFMPGLLNDGTLSRKPDVSPWGYGFGWLLKKNDTENIVWHDGGFNGFNALFYRDLNKELCLVILSNMGGDRGISAPVYILQNGILDILKNDTYTLPKADIMLVIKKIIETEGIDSAISRYYKLRNECKSQYDFSEKQLNQLGYHFMNENKLSIAISVLKLNVELYPEYSNGYDSLGEAYLKNGQNELAIKNFEKSLELNPRNTNAQEMLKKLKE